jgi:hypothetical protein
MNIPSRTKQIALKSRGAIFLAALASLSLGSALGQVTTNQIYRGLISYWPMDQLNTNGSGAVTTPDVVSGLDLTANGGITVGAGQFGNAITLDGTSGYLASLDTTSSGPPTNNLVSGLPYYDGQPLTIALWIKAPQPTSTSHYLFAMGSTTNANILYLAQSGSAAATESNLDCIIRNQNGTAPVNHPHSTNGLFNGAWHHLAWVDSNGVVSVYQDGVLEANSIVFSYWPNYLINPNAESAAGTYLFAMPINTFSLGALVRSSVSGYLGGTFDDVAVWDRALSQAEVQYVMSNSIAQPVSALPPSFTVPWLGQTNSMGDYVILNANAIGTPPLTLQWYENGSAIGGATNETLDLPAYNGTMTNSGTNVIYVVAANPNGQVTNGPAPLVVRPDPAPQLSIGCFGYWPLDTVNIAATTNTPDIYSVNNLNLLNMTSANLVPGEFSNALSFNSGSAQNAYLDGIVPAFNWTNYTISYWVNGTGAGQLNDFMFDNASSSSSTPLLGFCTPQSASGPTTNFCVLQRSDQNVAQLSDVISSNGVMDGTWHHVVWVDQAGSVTLYVDAAIDPNSFSYIRTNATPTLRSNLTWTLNSEALACLWRSSSAADGLTCEMDDVAWWNRGLSYTEVQELQANSVPLPTSLTAPSFATEPASLTNAYVGDTINFTTAVSGSPPISFQWYYNTSTNYTGAAISSALNPTATNSTLTLTPLQLTNAGYYYLTASNGAAPGSGQSGGGKTNSVPAQLIVHTYNPPPTNTNQVVLKLEFNAVSAPADVNPGFQTMNLNSGPTIFNGTTKVTISPLGGTILTDRDRTPLITNNPPLFNTAPLYDSFIFSDVENTAGTGIDILIQHLAPNTSYGVNIWSYDEDSTSLRVSDWTEAISGATIMYQYNFNGANPPVADYDFTFGAILTSDPNGQLDIQGVADPSYLSEFDVFLNALVITANPVPQIVSSAINTADGNLLISAQAQYSGQTLIFQESPDLINWQNANDGQNQSQHGPIFTSEFPLSASVMFYRAVSQ